MMELRDFYAEVGGDYEKVLKRIPLPSLLQGFIVKFSNDPSYTELKEALEAADIEKAFAAAHTMKGTAANLGLDRLAEALSVLTEQLRNTSVLPEEQYAEAVDEIYQETLEKIKQLES